MKSLDVANFLIERFGNTYPFTNMKLNKLVFFMQAHALKNTGAALFDDEIQAWDYGPVEPSVYFSFRQYGKGIIRQPMSHYQPTEENKNILESIANAVMSQYGVLTAFDLMRLSHRPGGAWEKTFQKGANNTITNECIMHSTDMDGFSQDATVAAAIKDVENKWPNALRLLENS